MKIFNLIHGDKVWVYNLTKKVYSEIETYKHNKDNTTTFSITGREAKYLPEGVKTVPAMKLVQEEQDGEVINHVIHRHNLLDRLRDFKNSTVAAILETFEEEDYEY